MLASQLLVTLTDKLLNGMKIYWDMNWKSRHLLSGLNLSGQTFTLRTSSWQFWDLFCKMLQEQSNSNADVILGNKRVVRVDKLFHNVLALRELCKYKTLQYWQLTSFQKAHLDYLVCITVFVHICSVLRGIFLEWNCRDFPWRQNVLVRNWAKLLDLVRQRLQSQNKVFIVVLLASNIIVR